MTARIFFLWIAIVIMSCGNEKSMSYENYKGTTSNDVSSVIEEVPEMAVAQEVNFVNDGYAEKTTLQTSDQSGLIAFNQPQGKDVPKPKEPVKKDNKKIIKTANMSIEVEQYTKARTSLEDLIKKHDAYLAKEQETSSSYQRNNHLVIRMAPNKFDAFVEDVVSLALNVDSKNIDATDVTKEFVDMETRLDTKRRMAERYRDILKQAKTIEDILRVEERLRVITEEIESVEGQLKYMRDQVQYSTVNLTFYETLEQGRVAKKGFFRRVARSFGTGWDGLLEFMIGLVTIWPFWFGVAGFIWLVRRVWKSRKPNTKA